MDYTIRQDVTRPEGFMEFNKNQDIRTDIYNSLNTRKGDCFWNKDFGCELFKIKKVNTSNILLAQQYTQSALQWLITAGRAVSIDVIVEADISDFNRMNIKVTAKQPNGYLITYEVYQRVGQGGPNFVQPA